MASRRTAHVGFAPIRQRLASLLLCLCGAGCSLASTAAIATGFGAAGEPVIVLLDANFDDKIVGSQIGTGGPEVGEPIVRPAELSAIVVDTPLPTRALAISHDVACCAQSLAFELLDDAEITTGEVSVFFVVHLPTLGDFNVFVRERDGATRSFASLRLQVNGSIRLQDPSGTILIGSYAPGDTLAFELIFDMDARTYDVLLNGVLEVDDRAHGVTDRGVGRIIAGTNPGADNLFYFDELSVIVPDPNLFQSGFEAP